MLCILFTLSLLSVLCVDGIEPETGSPSTRAVSTQSYHRGDVPLSYSITSYHDYTTIRPIYAVNNIPQYAPLQYDTLPVYNDQLNQPPLHSTYKEQLKLSLLNQYQPNENTLQTAEKKNLEPRMVPKNQVFQNDEYYTSFVPGHNVVVSPRFRHKSPISTDLYKTYLEPVKSQKIIVPKYILQEKQKQQMLVQENQNQQMLVQKQVVKTEPEATHLKNAGFPAISIEGFPANDVPKNQHEHNEVLFPQLPPPRAPRLHLNIARVYGIAHIPHQAPEPAMNREKPPSHTQAIIGPQPEITTQDKTLLYPINGFQRYPIQVVPNNAISYTS